MDHQPIQCALHCGDFIFNINQVLLPLITTLICRTLSIGSIHFSLLHCLSNLTFLTFPYSVSPTHFVMFYFHRVSLCKPSWPQTYNAPTSGSQVLGLYFEPFYLHSFLTTYFSLDSFLPPTPLPFLHATFSTTTTTTFLLLALRPSPWLSSSDFCLSHSLRVSALSCFCPTSHCPCAFPNQVFPEKGQI